MVRTTPSEKSNLHLSWHIFQKGLCLYCGYYCDDCPNDVVTCKCPPIVKKADVRLAQETSGETDSWVEYDE